MGGGTCSVPGGEGGTIRYTILCSGELSADPRPEVRPVFVVGSTPFMLCLSLVATMVDVLSAADSTSLTVTANGDIGTAARVADPLPDAALVLCLGTTVAQFALIHLNAIPY